MARDDGPLIISGPSGVGKTSVARALSGGSERFALAVTSTTRAARPGELDGRDYHFLSVEEFDRLVKNDGFIEHVSARGAQYGLTKAELERIWKDGRVPILVLDPDGMDAVKALYPQALSVFIDAPSAVVTERLLARGDTDVASRMRDNLKVWAARGGYDVVIGNESDLAACVDGVRRAFEDRFDTAYNARELEARQKGGTPMKGVLIPTDGAPRPIDIQKDSDGSALHSLQQLVGGNIEAFPVIFGDDICVYVNEEGLYNCPPNRAVYATQGMEEAGYISQLDYDHAVKEGELYTVLFGDLVAVGYDPETGEDRDLTDSEVATVIDYFTKVSTPGSGFREVLAIQSGTYRRASEERVTLKEEAESSREAADSLSAERTSEEPNRDAPAIE